MAHNRGMTRTLTRSLLLLAAAATLLVSVFAAPTAMADERPQGTTATASASEASVLGKRLSERFLTLLKDKDVEGLRALLSPAFQLQRANGEGAAKAAYLKDLPTIGAFDISDVVGTRSGDTLVVRYVADVEGVVDGEAYSPGPAPRISTFIRSGGRWQLVSHANFNALAGSTTN